MQQKRGEINLVFAMYMSKYAVFAKKFLEKSPEGSVFIRAKSTFVLL